MSGWVLPDKGGFNDMGMIFQDIKICNGNWDPIEDDD